MPNQIRIRLASLTSLLIAVLAICPAARGDSKTTPQICVVVVGFPSKNVAEWATNEEFEFKVADEGKVPPTKLFYKGEGAYQAQVFNLGQSTPPITAAQSPLVFYKSSDPAEGPIKYTPEFEIAALDTALTAAVLWTDEKNPNWKEPNTLTIDASADAWPEGEVRFINLSNAMMSLTVGGEELELKPEASHAGQVEGDKALPYKISAVIEGKSSFVCNTTITMSSPKRTLIVMYDGENGRAGSLSIDIPMP